VFILNIARDSGYNLVDQGTMTPDANVMDDQWESIYFQLSLFVEHVERESLSEDQEKVVLEFVPKVKYSVEGNDMKYVSSI
jgi:hypothetical protein